MAPPAPPIWWCRCCSSAPSSAPAHRRAGRAVALPDAPPCWARWASPRNCCWCCAAYRKPLSNQPLQLALLVSAVDAGSQLAGAAAALGMWLANGYGLALGFGLIVLALHQAMRSNPWPGSRRRRFAGHHQSGHARLITRCTATRRHWPCIARARCLHGLHRDHGLGHGMRYATCAGAQAGAGPGPSFDPVTRLPSHAHAGRLVALPAAGRRSRWAWWRVTLANLATLEALARARRLQTALYVSAGRLRRCTPWAPSSAGWAMTASWCWCARKTPNSSEAHGG